MKAPEIVSKVLLKMREHCYPGVSTFTIDCIAEEEIKRLGGYSYNKGFLEEWSEVPYPAVSCISVNDVIAHGIPSEKVILKEGDVVTLDIGVIDSEGNCGDAAMCVPVGEISDKDDMLLRYAKKVLYAGIEQVKDGVTINDIAYAMQRKAGERQFTINHQMCGHVIGKRMHEKPYIYQVPNHYHADREKYLEYQNNHMDVTLHAGQIICLEPCLTYTDKWGYFTPDGWELRTNDGKKSAMFEHMILILKDGYEILTNHVTL